MAAPRDAVGNGRTRRRMAAGNRATRRCRRRIANMVCELGARRAHCGTSQRGETVQAASSQAARPERDARSELWPGARQDRKRHVGAEPRTATHRETAGNGLARRRVVVGNRATRRCRRRIATTVCELGAQRAHLGTSQRGPHARAASSHTAETPQNKRCGMAQGKIASGTQRAASRRQHPATPRATGEQGAGWRRTDGQQGVAGGESLTRFASWARGTRTLGHHSGAQP